jgi:hypothetical protein
VEKFVSRPTEVFAFMFQEGVMFPAEFNVLDNMHVQGNKRLVKTAHGWVTFEPGAWLIREANPADGWYPCSDEEFKRKYRPATMAEGLPIPGYVPQNPRAISKVSFHKELEEHVLQAMDTMKDPSVYDQRWLAIAKTHIEQGFMALNRAVFKPTRVILSGDKK